MIKIYSLLFWLVAIAIVYSGGLYIMLRYGDGTPMLMLIIAAVAIAMSAATSLTKKDRYHD